MMVEEQTLILGVGLSFQVFLALVRHILMITI